MQVGITFKQNCQSNKQICYYNLEISGVGLRYFHDLRRRSGYGAKPLGHGVDAESKIRFRPPLSAHNKVRFLRFLFTAS